MTTQDAPPLAHYRNVAQYVPRHGDLIIWAGWFSVWFGLVCDFDRETKRLSVIFGGVPVILVGMSESEQGKNTKTIPLSQITTGAPGTWAVLQHEIENNVQIWYV